MRSPEEIQHLAQMFWVDEAFDDEETFHRYRHIIVREVHRLCQAWDLDGVKDWLAVYQTAEPQCRAEPLTTPYEYGLLLITVSIATTHSAMGSFNTLYMLSEQILALLHIGDERRSRLRLMERPNSEIRYYVYSALAQAKWQGPAAERDRLLPVEAVASDYCRAADRALSWLATNPDHDPSRVHEALAQSGVDVAAMLFRWFDETLPARAVEFLEWHNSISSSQLALEVGHCLSHQPLVNNANYWTYELAKLHLTGRLTKDILEYCHAQRLATVLNTLNEPRPVDGVYGCWDRENEMMLAAIHEKTRRS